MSWAKIHTDILGDPKLLQAARRGTRGLELLPWLIVFAKQADAGGRLAINGGAAEAVDIARLVPCVSKFAIERCIASCEKLGILEPDGDGVLRFPTWQARQGKPSDHPEQVRDRVQRHRERLKRNAQPETLGLALPVTPSNAIEEKRGEEEERRGEDVTPSATNWPARMAAIFAESIGVFEPGLFGRYLAPAVAQHGVEAVLAAATLYAKDAPQSEKPQFLKPKHFAEQVGVWVQRARPVQTYAENGVDPSPEFLAAMGRKP